MEVNKDLGRFSIGLVVSVIFIITCWTVANQPDATMEELSPESRIELKYELLNDDKSY
jgi:hypothetical protein